MDPRGVGDVRSRRRGARVAVLLCLTLLPACERGATQLLVVVATDLVPEEQLHLVRIRASQPTSDAPLSERVVTVRIATTSEPSDVTLPFSFGVTPRLGDASRRVHVSVEGFGSHDDLSGPPRVRRDAVAGFRAHAALALPIFLSQSCVGVVCDPEAELTCVDGRCASAEVSGLAEVEPGTELRDAAAPPTAADAGIEPDAQEPCALEPPGGALASFAFEDPPESSVVIDAVGTLDGAYIGVVGRAPGPSGCGNAALFSAGYIALPESMTLNSSLRSIELWMWRSDVPPATSQGIVSRDSEGSHDGDLTLYLTHEGRLVLRLQIGDVEYWRCSGVVPAQTWIRVGVALGPPDLELWVDGTRAVEPDARFIYPTDPYSGSSTLSCGGHFDALPSDNWSPWAIGASFESVAQTGDVTQATGLFDGRIDQVVFSSERTDFARAR